LISEKGWIRAVRGHGLDINGVAWKEGDGPGIHLEAETTDKILIFAGNGKFYTLGGDKLPRGRGFGEPLRLMADMPQDAEPVMMAKYDAKQKFLVASSEGRGFIVKAEDVLAQTKSGKQVLNVEAPEKAVACAPVTGDHAAVIGDNRKLILFPVSEIPEMGRGR